MVAGGVFGVILFAFIVIFLSIWLILRALLLYCKWFHRLDIRFDSLGLGTIENLQVTHRLFHMRIRSLQVSSISSILTCRLPLIFIDQIHLKIPRLNEKFSQRKKTSTDYRKFCRFLQYVSVSIEHIQVEYDNVHLSFQRLSLHPSPRSNHFNAETAMVWDDVQLLIYESSHLSTLIFKSTWNSVEIQTNFDQKFLINATHGSIDVDSKLFHFLQRTRSKNREEQRRSSNFRYINRTLVPVQETNESKRFLTIFDQLVEYLHDPNFDLSIKYFQFQYRSANGQNHCHSLDSAHFSFHNASKISTEALHAYTAKIQLDSQSTLLLHSLCLITIYPLGVDISCQLNEFFLELREETIEQICQLNSSRSSSSSSSNIPWKCDRQIDLSFQFLNPSLSLKLSKIDPWFICQMSLFKMNFHWNPNDEMRSLIELKNLLIRSSIESERDATPFQTLLNDLSRDHLWNCLGYLSESSVKIHRDNVLRLQLDINQLRLQSNEISIALIQRFREISHSRRNISPPTPTDQRQIDLSLSMKMVSIVICDTVPVFLHLSISTLRANQTAIEMKKILAFLDQRSVQNLPFTSLTRGEKMLDIRRLNVERSPTNATTRLIFPHDITLVWSTKLHLFLYRFILSLNSLRTSPSSTNESSGNNQKFEILFEKCAHAFIQLSTDSRLHFSLDQLSMQFIRQVTPFRDLQIFIKTPKLLVDCQQQCFFQVENISFSRLPHSDALTTERVLLQKTIGSLEMIRNRASSLEVQTFSIRFPFDSTFNEVIEKAVNIRKWLKRLHRTNCDLSQDFLREIPQHNISNEVWTDLSIKVDDFELTIADDLFEMKLFQNYCLMADEYHERELREQELQRRIDEFERHSQPLNNILQLKRALAEISSRVYVERCRKTNFDPNHQRITRNLIRWHLRHVNLIALADRSWTGKENILNVIHQIDHESPKIPLETSDLCTIWCRYVLWKCEEWSIHFRDFRQPLWQMQQFHLWGQICAAEVTPDTLESIRNPWVEIGEPYSPSRVQVQRLLSPLKFYHDVNSDIGSFLVSYGPAWENTMAQVNLCLNGITPRASDPSPLLSWWDKMRLYLHGRWSFATGKMSWLYHVASSPYNDTEEMEWLWDQAYVDWTNGKFLFQAASLSIKLRTSSKYDDCCLLFLPNIDTRITLQWLCQGDPNDHHAVRLHTRDAVRTRNRAEPHDSYALYRSHHLKLTAKFECKDIQPGSTPPTCTIYASTLRFCERVKNTMMSITRPTRRGPLFLGPGETSVPPRKPLLSRHYESIELQLILPQFRVKYLTSFARQTGAQLDCQMFNFVTHQSLRLIDYNDGLARRARIAWTPKMMNVHLKCAEMWLLRDANEDKETNDQTARSEHREPDQSQQERTFFLSLDSLIYVRSPTTSSKTSTHSILIDELKAVWNLTNRRTLFLVYERYQRNNILRSNLSNPFAKELEHLQQEKISITPSDQSPSEENSARISMIAEESTTNSTSSFNVAINGVNSQPSTLASFLDQLISESEHKPSVDLDQTVDASVSLVGLRQCTKDDVDEHTLHIELTHSQIALRGTESRGYVILSAKLALVDQYRHHPVWRDQQLCDKTSWHGDLQAMQYYATTDHSSPSNESSPDAEIIWVPRQNIRDEESFLGESTRSVIGSIASNDGHSDQQLQCIISKSNATLSYVFYTEQTQQEEETEKNIVIPPFTKPMNENHPIGESDRLLVDSFTFIHNDIQLSTNSSQYRTIADIVNNVLLYVEPKEEGANNKLRKLRLQIQLANNLPVLRESIRHLLERVRSTLAELRRLEREIFYYTRYRRRQSSESSSSDEEDERDAQNEGVTARERALSFTTEEYEQLQISYNSVKAELSKLAEKLGMMCAVYKDMQIARIVKMRIAATTNKVARLERRYELHGGSITWFIKHEDGQITNAQFLLRNILYTKRYYENGTNEHAISIGQAQVDNLLPDDRYRTILTSNCQQQQTMIRVYCKEGESIGGIPVKEHLEINVAPLVIQMTRRFSQMLMAFLFPNKSQGQNDLSQQNNQRLNKPTGKHSNSTALKRRTRSAEGEEELLTGRSLYYFSNRDLDQMEKRAKNILTFQYIKIPEVSLIVSYKIRGTKEKKIGDLENAHISFPTLEYRDLTCGWHDLVLAIKSDVKTVLLSQAIRQNINLRLPFIGKSTRAQNQQLLATTVNGSMNSSTMNALEPSNQHDTANSNDFDDEEQKHKMKLVLGTKISKDLLGQLKRRKEP